MKAITVSILLCVFMVALFSLDPLYAQEITLVRFGNSAANTTFDLSGWTTILKSSNQQFTSQGNGGLITVGEVEEFDDFRGVRGTPRRFTKGERIVVTWYNNSDETFFFTARISFTEEDEPNPESPDGRWYTMRSFLDYREGLSEIQPHGTAKTVFNITDTGVHKTDSTYSLVNINLVIEWGSTHEKQFLICESIELMNDADITPPSPPTGLAATPLSDSKIRLTWGEPSDDVGVVEYLIYRDGEIEGYSRSSEYTCVYLEPEQEYIFSITALDAAGNESSPCAAVRALTLAYQGGNDLINPAGFTYLGAFAAPEDFNWGGEAIAYNPNGDPSGPVDGFSGSLFLTNLNQQAYGFIGAISIPPPVVSSSKDVASLNQATTIIPPVNIRPANVNSWDYVDIWRTGLEYLSDENRLYSSWSIHYTVSGEKHASISCCDATNLAGSTKFGAWYIGSPTSLPIDAGANDYLFSAPQDWADANCSGRSIVVGRYRDGGLSGLGPTLYAFAPVGSSPLAPNAELPITTLLEYGSVEETDNYHFPNSIDGYNHADDWREAMWVAADGQNAVVIVGAKALGHNWYGYTGERMPLDWVFADVPMPEFWETDPDGKGWRSHNRQPMFIFFDPKDLAKVARGEWPSYQPQPYAALRIPREMFYGRLEEIFSASYDSQHRLLYVTEFVRDPDGQLIIHVWQVNAVTTSVGTCNPSINGWRLEQNFPNPFNAETSICFQMPKAAEARLTIYNLQGKCVRTLFAGYKPAGRCRIVWDGLDDSGRRAASGVYVCRFQTGDIVLSKKLILSK